MITTPRIKRGCPRGMATYRYGCVTCFERTGRNRKEHEGAEFAVGQLGAGEMWEHLMVVHGLASNAASRLMREA